MILSNSMHNIMNMPAKQGGKIGRRATGTKCNFPHSHFSGYALNNFCSFLRDFKWQKYFLGNMFLVLRFFGIWNFFLGNEKAFGDLIIILSQVSSNHWNILFFGSCSCGIEIYWGQLVIIPNRFFWAITNFLEFDVEQQMYVLNRDYGT